MTLRVELAAMWAVLLFAVSAYAGETVKGTVLAARAEGSIVRLELDDPGVSQVTLLIGWLSNFPPAPEQYYLGKVISVRGSVQSFRGRSEILVRDADDIVVLSAAAPVADATRPEPGEVEKLRDRVRTLEQRLRELELRNRALGGRDE